MIVHISEYVYIVIYIYMLSNLLYLEDDVMPSKPDIAIFMAFLQKNHEVLPLARRPIAGGGGVFGGWNLKEV